MAIPPIPMPAGRGVTVRNAAIDRAAGQNAPAIARQSVTNQLNSYISAKKDAISQGTTVKSLTPPAPYLQRPAIMQTAKPDAIGDLIKQNYDDGVPRVIVPGTKTTRNTTIVEKAKKLKEVATDIQDPAGPNKAVGKSYREIHHKLAEEEQLDELLSRKNLHKNTLGALEKREVKFTKKLSRPLAKKMIGRYFEEEQLDEMSAKEALKLAHEEGFEKDRQSGSHIQLVHKKTGRRVTIPMHGSKDLKYKTAKDILQKIGRYEQVRKQRKLEEEAIKKNIMNKVKKLKAEEAVNTGGKNDTGSLSSTVTMNPDKDILKGQTR